MVEILADEIRLTYLGKLFADEIGQQFYSDAIKRRMSVIDPPVKPKMLALALIKQGSKNILDYQHLPIPVPKKGEVLVKVEYCGLNHLDLLIKAGRRLGPTSFPHILGSEIVGRLVDTQEQVVIYPWIFCNKCKQCKEGNENICDFGGTIGRTRNGGYAEYVVVPKRNALRIPQNLRPDWVCALTLAGTTAHHLVDRAKVRNKSICLVTGATGGVGTVVIQLLRQIYVNSNTWWFN